MSKRTPSRAAKTPNIFVPLMKVDEENQLVYGRITEELLDKSGEVMDYETSKPFFEKWSNGQSEASNGLSKGNVRVMHGLVAAGKLTELDFNDGEKAIDVCAKIVDEGEWNKVIEGVYTGFSVGGKYEKRWTHTDESTKEKIKKYTANPVEVSLVDNPCVPSATFTMTKADGTSIEIAFQVENDDDEWPGFTKAAENADVDKAEDANASPGAAAQGSLDFVPTNDDVAARAEKLAKDAGGNKPWFDFVNPAREELIAEHLSKKTDDDKPEGGKEDKKEEEGKGDTTDDKKKEGGDKPIGKTTPAGVRQVWTASDGNTFDKKADAEAHEASLITDPEDPATKLAKALAEAVGATTAAEAERAEPTVFTDLERLHKAVLELEQPRDSETGEPLVEKGMYTVSRFANMLSDVAGLVRTIKAEAKLEEDSDDESVVTKVKAALSGFGGSFLDYAKQQVAEMLAGMDADLSPRCCYDYYYRAAEADADNTLAKDVVDLIDGVKDFMPTEEELSKRAPTDEMGKENSELQKKFDELSAKHEKLIKVSTEAVEQIGGLTKRVKMLEDTPLPRAPTNAPVGKGDDQFFGKTAPTEEDKMAVLANMVKEHGPDKMAEMMIKHAQTKPIVMGVR